MYLLLLSLTIVCLLWWHLAACTRGQAAVSRVHCRPVGAARRVLCVVIADMSMTYAHPVHTIPLPCYYNRSIGSRHASQLARCPLQVAATAASRHGRQGRRSGTFG